ncbi:alpha/beta hydrolase [Muricauda sp. CAU 1633]|uniref:alpha/beta fold hydrolase n=1 Tax=Allomuricauda sp. CAU 1633 TaxID=2816036 RepID=UPI001A8C3B48|nr:alpha/beta hydrolase [Muricauda sp. CAU 1633]MBO0320740.1 alpha/beta hydrolase [Muricauda sp. CAU 1633]
MNNIGYMLLGLILFCSCTNKPNYHYVEIQNRQQYVLTWGEGEPVVVFLCGGGSDLKDFEEVQKNISQTTKTISYDKFGIGKSELIGSPRTLENVSSELKDLLKKEGVVDTPIILVGHSMGGSVARYYLHRYPTNIVGLILIDPGSEFINEEHRKVQTEEEIRIEDSIFAAQIKLIPKGFRMEVDAYHLHDSILRTFPFKTEIPITLLESNQVDKNDSNQIKLIQVQKRLYRDFREQVPQMKIISTEKSGHFIQLDEPHLVIDAIKEMLVTIK